MRIPAVITDSSITLTGPDFVPRAIPSSHPNFKQIRDLLENGADWSQLKDLVDLPSAIATYTSGRIKVVSGELFFDNQPVHNNLADRILKLISDKQENTAEPLIKFMEKVNQNPSRDAVDGLYDWLVKSNLPIAPDGDFIAWKIVRADYKDEYTGRFDNSIGKIVEMSRSAVDANRNRTCSSGLHFCSSEYLPHYGSSGSRVVVVKVNPRDVVAFPPDYNTSKGRACRYEVIGEVKREDAPNMFKGVNVLRDLSAIGGVNPSVPGNVVVSGVYLTRAGEKVIILEDTGHAEYPFKGDNGAAYSSDGAFLTGVELPQDLVKRLA